MAHCALPILLFGRQKPPPLHPPPDKVSPAEAEVIVQPIKKKIIVDPDNPPQEVREAAADMGISVREYKDLYLDRPHICEVFDRAFARCLNEDASDAESRCYRIMSLKESVHNCRKFEERYAGQLLKY